MIIIMLTMIILMMIMMCVCTYVSQKLSGSREEVVEEQQAQVLEDVHSITVTSRLAQPFKYRTTISHSLNHYVNQTN